MGGQGGGVGGLFSGGAADFGNSQIENRGARIFWNFIDPMGGTTSQFGPIGAIGRAVEPNQRENLFKDTPEKLDDPDQPVVEPIPEDPAVAEARLSEESRQEEMRKRRLRTKTLLSDQEDTGTATVGTKTLLGG